MRVHGAQTNIHFHDSGVATLASAAVRERNTTIVIGADQDKGVLLLDIDVQADVCSGADELRQQLLMIAEALEGADPFADTNTKEH